MRTLWRLASRSVYLPFLDKAQETIEGLRSSGRALFIFFAGMLVASSFGLLYTLNDRLITPVPAHGGSLTEGIIGSPRFINPVLAISDADHDMAALVYVGLLRATPSGDYVPSLAQGYEISEDGRTYTFTIKEGVIFHDGKPVTADDVVFTVQKAQNPALKSPVRANWEGVLVEKVDDRTVRFTLPSSYAPFIENLTLGILPRHLWQNVSDEEFPFSNLNTLPVGAGPFRVASISRSTAGIPSSYDLRPFSSPAQTKPFLSKLTLRFYQNETALIAALKKGEVEAASGISPASTEEIANFNIERSPLNRVFGIFFNQNQSEILRDRDVRAALEAAVDREKLVAQVLGGFGVALESPVPPTVVENKLAGAEEAGGTETMAMAAAENSYIERARAMLSSDGWEAGEDGILQKTIGDDDDEATVRLAFTISTGNVPELRAAAEEVASAWRQVGADVTLEIFDQGDLSQNVIRPRKYDALLFGEVVGRALDLYAFWHSSQRNDPGLNIALYANSTADTILESLRATQDEEERMALYSQFEEELRSDIPAIFLYAPDFVYSVPNNIEGVSLGFIGKPSDRFLSVSEWHREVDYVWPFFSLR